jgi:hypothetical protein
MLDADQAWMVRGACRSRPELGWIKEPADVGLGETATMAVVCARCPVLDECAAFVARKHIRGGFWAGQHRDIPQAETYGGAA